MNEQQQHAVYNTDYPYHLNGHQQQENHSSRQHFLSATYSPGIGGGGQFLYNNNNCQGGIGEPVMYNNNNMMYNSSRSSSTYNNENCLNENPSEYYYKSSTMMNYYNSSSHNNNNTQQQWLYNSSINYHQQLPSCSMIPTTGQCCSNKPEAAAVQKYCSIQKESREKKVTEFRDEQEHYSSSYYYESDIVVEDSLLHSDDETVTTDESDVTTVTNMTTTKNKLSTNCLLCNETIKEIQYCHLMTESTPCTLYSQTTFFQKFTTLLGVKPKLEINASYLCNQCTSRLNTYDHLQLQLESIEKYFLNKYTNPNAISIPPIHRERVRKKRRICGVHFFKCKLCRNKQFSLRNFYRYHMKKHRFGKMKKKSHRQLNHRKPAPIINQCSTCKKEFQKKSDLKCHLQTHSDQRNFLCKVCGKTYKTLSNLNYHSKTHLDKLPFACDVCQKGFLRRDNLQAHLNTHNGHKPFSCGRCDKKFASRKNLDAHLKVHNGTLKKKECKLCGKHLIHGLEEHMRIHSKHKHFQCDVCKMMFFTKGALMKHTFRKHDEHINII